MKSMLKRIILIYLIFPVLVFSQQITDTIIINKNNSPFYITKDYVVPDTSILLIEKGAEIILSDSVNITVLGKLNVNGSKKHAVIFKTKNDSISWGRIIIKTKEKAKIRYANFVNGAISAYNTNVYIANSNFYFYSTRKFDGWAIYYSHNTQSYFFNNKIINYSGRYVGEGININNGQIYCANNYIEKIPDAIELTNTTNSFVIGNFIKYSWDDAIDINGCQNLEIKNNTTLFIDDKAISIGRNNLLSSDIKIEENFIRKAKFGLSIKDSSNVKISRNIIANTKTALQLYQKNENTGGGYAILKNNIFINNNQQFSIDTLSEISVTNCISNKEDYGLSKFNLSVDTLNYTVYTKDSIDSDEFYRLNLLDKDTIISESTIPVMFIQTFPKVIIDDERISAKYKIYNDEIKINSGKLSIEIRGSNSITFSKKSYGISLNKKQNILEMPSSKDWVLYGPYYDKSFLRNAVAYSVGNKLDIKSPEFRFIQLYINDQEKGLYLLVQKIKRSKSFVNVEKTNSTDVDGGYIFKIDKGTGSNSWVNLCTSDSSEDINYYTHYPKPQNITQNQQEYLKNYIKNCEKNLYKKHIKLNAIDINSFVDYVLVSELMKNFDAYRTSIYFYKYKNKKKLYIGPIWDFNISSGNCYLIDFNNYKYFVFDSNKENQRYIASWWYNLLLNKKFAKLLRTRWKTLRKNDLSNAEIANLVANLNNEILSYTDYQQIEFLTTWLINRATWLDKNIKNINNTAKKYYTVKKN